MSHKDQENLFYRIRQILLFHWDPIGVHEFRIADDEYDSYIPKILSMLDMGVEVEAIARYLSEVRTASIGLPQNMEKDISVARLLLGEYQRYKVSISSDTETKQTGITPDELAYIAAKYSFAGISIEEMQRFINRLIEEGVYYDTFFDVLYPDEAVTEIVGAAFKKSLQSLEIPIPEYEDAIWVIIYYHLMKIANREIDPYEGLKKLFYEVYWKYDFYKNYNKYLGDSHGIDMLIGLFWNYDEIFDEQVEVSFNNKYGEEAIVELKKEIYNEAKRWISEFKFNQP